MFYFLFAISCVPFIFFSTVTIFIKPLFILCKTPSLIQAPFLLLSLKSFRVQSLYFSIQSWYISFRLFIVLVEGDECLVSIKACFWIARNLFTQPANQCALFILLTIYCFCTGLSFLKKWCASYTIFFVFNTNIFWPWYLMNIQEMITWCICSGNHLSQKSC